MAWRIGQRQAQRPMRRRIVVAAEGEVTEPQYFQRLNSMCADAVFNLVENLGKGSDPRTC